MNTNASYYHTEYGHVRVIEVGEDAIVFEHCTEAVDAVGEIPTTWSEPAAQFDDQTESVDHTVGASSETLLPDT